MELCKSTGTYDLGVKQDILNPRGDWVFLCSIFLKAPCFTQYSSQLLKGQQATVVDNG